MKNYLTVGTAALIAGGLMSLGVAFAAEQGSPSTSHKDSAFFKEAAQGGMAEVTLGKMAAKKATNEDVKRFGQRMADDHSKANEELKKIAASHSVTLPTELL